MEKHSKRVYLDSNVFISLFNEEIGAGFRGLFAESESFFEKARQHKIVLVLSDLFFKEVQRFCHITKEETIEYIEKRGIKIEIADDMLQSLVVRFVGRGMHFLDASHAALAVSNNCDCIVTFNVKDFECVADQIVVLPPAEFT